VVWEVRVRLLMRSRQSSKDVCGKDVVLLEALGGSADVGRSVKSV